MSLLDFLLFRNKETSVLASRQYGKINNQQPKDVSALASRKYGQVESVELKETSTLAYGQYCKDVDISISRQEDYDKVTVADYYTITDFVDKMKEIDDLGVDKLLHNSVVWNSSKQRVNKGIYFVFDHKGSLYNILINDEIIKIDERHVLDNKTFNSVVTFYNNSKLYEYFTCMHDENGSTYDTRYYSSKGDVAIKVFEMTRSEVLDDWIFITRSLKTFKAIDQIVDMKKLDDYVFVKLDEYLFDKKDNKMIK